jgi:hypothetical protein
VNELKRNILTGEILDCCIEVHRHLGPGLLESVYEACLMHEFALRGIQAKRQVIVEDEFILELKSVETIMPVHKAQLISYIKLAKKKVGFLINFNVPLLKNGFHRIIYGYDDEVNRN